MLKRFYKLRMEIKMACIRAELQFTLSAEYLEKINQLCQALTPLQFATKKLSKTDADQMTKFVISRLEAQNSDISQVLRDAFQERVWRGVII